MQRNGLPFGTVAAIVIGGAIALWQVLEVRTQRNEQSRPYVIVDFESRSFLVLLQIDPQHRYNDGAQRKDRL